MGVASSSSLPLPLSPSLSHGSLKAAAAAASRQPTGAMTTVGGLVLLGLLVSAHCEVRARDPEVQEELGGRVGGGGGFPQNLEGLHPRDIDTPLVEAEGNYPARSG